MCQMANYLTIACECLNLLTMSEWHLYVLMGLVTIGKGNRLSFNQLQINFE